LKNLGSRLSRIQSGFCALFFFTTILAFTAQATASTGMLIPNPTKANFGTVGVGSSQPTSVTLTNPGGPKVTITDATLTGTGFSLSGLHYPVTLSGGQSVPCTVTFAPQAAGTYSGNLSISYSANGKGNNYGSGTLSVPLSGTGVTQGQLSPNPSSLNFQSVQVGNSQTLQETVSNSGGETVNISQATVSGTGFSISGINPPLSLTPGESITFNATFAPQSQGSASGNITITSDAINSPLTISLAGNGTAAGQLNVTPTSYNFGNVTVGSSASTTASLSASGASVTVNSVTFSNSEFSLSGISFPLTLSAGQSVSFSVIFAPQASGTVSATASFASNAANSPTVLSLGGTGTPPQQYSVNLSWTASTDPNVNGYNVYRGTTSGGPYTQINSGLDSGTTYTDSSVTGGQTYYYVTTAVANNQESAYSNETSASIP
jgi:hypothetical protein